MKGLPVVTLGDAFDIVRNGKSVKQSEDAGGLPITRIETITDGQVDEHRVGYAGLGSTGNEQWLLQQGDILFSHINSVQHVGKCALYEGTPANLVHGMNLLALRPSKSLHPRFALYALRQPEFRAHLLKFVNKAVNQASVSTTNLKSLPFPLPPLPEQRRIAAILDKADALRRKRQRAIELLDNFTQSIFLEMFGSARHIPTKLFGKSLSRPLRNGVSPAKSGSVKSRVLTLSSVTGKVFKADAAKDADFAAQPPPSQCVVEGDFLICRGNGNKSLVGIGVVAPVSMADTAFPDTIIAAKVDDKVFDSRYFEHVWNSPLVRRQLEQSARTTNGTFKVNQQVLERIEVPSPDRRLQAEFGRRVISIAAQHARLQGQLEHQQNLFASLQHRAFSGQL